METRTLQCVGGGTYTVSIPKQWATNHAFEGGSTVHLYTHSDGSLVVRSGKKDSGALESATIQLEGSDPAHLSQLVRVAYAIGFDSITVETTEAFGDEQRRALRALVRSQIGTELITEQPETITIQTVLDASDVSVRQSLLQLQFLARSIQEESTAALVRDDEPAQRLEEATRLADLITRQFNRCLLSFEELDQLECSRAELFDYHCTATQLETVADRGTAIAALANQLETPLPDPLASEVQRAAEATAAAIEDATNAVISEQPRTAHDALDACDAANRAVASTEDALFADPPGQLDLRELCAVVRGVEKLSQCVAAGSAIATVALRSVTRAEAVD